MSIAISPTESDVRTRLRSFLVDVLPPGTEVVRAQDNRVPEPIAGSWVMMTPLRTPRLATNVDDAADSRFTGSITGQALTVDDVQIGSVVVGAFLFGAGVADGTKVTSGPSGGGPGVYVVSVSQTVPDGTVMSAGRKSIEMDSEWVYQLDFRSDPSDAVGPSAGDMAETVSAMFRDEYATAFFSALGDEVSPLHADDPRQMPFTQDQQQYEIRWIVEAHLQVNQTLVAPQQYADSVAVEVISVDATYPPS